MTTPSFNLILGMRFVPKDDELLRLLDGKLKGFQIPPDFNVIVDEEVYKTEPWKLRRDTVYKLENEVYYFTVVKRKSRQGKNSILERTAGNGFWHMNGQNIPIKYNDKVVGHKTALKYYHYDKNRNKVQTKWIMNEYRLKALSDDFEKPAELVLCRIQRTRTGSDIEEEFAYNYEEESSNLYNIAHHQATLADHVQDLVNSDDWERPRSKRLKRDNINNGSTKNTVPDQHDQLYFNTSSVPHQRQQQQQEDYQQQALDTGMENSTIAPPCSEAENEKRNAFGDDWMAMIEVPSPNVLLPFPDDVFKLEDHMMNASLNSAAATTTQDVEMMSGSSVPHDDNEYDEVDEWLKKTSI